VLHADATALPFEAGRFSAATLFTMLHHVPSPAQQDQMLAELRRVLRPGGVLAGTDGVETPARRELHVDDAYLPIDPATMADRLAAAGFTRVTVEVEEDRFRFAATAPGAGR
jgi:ubiquinone/menaquinone biosynthesis C-methylase UbiE